MPDEVEHGVMDMAVENVAGLKFSGRHPFNGVAIKNLADELGLRELEEESRPPTKG